METFLTIVLVIAFAIGALALWAVIDDGIEEDRRRAKRRAEEREASRRRTPEENEQEERLLRSEERKLRAKASFDEAQADALLKERQLTNVKAFIKNPSSIRR